MSSVVMTPKRKFIIDTDAGLDDAQAILMALATPDVDVVALTTVSGNTRSAQVAKNLLRLLKVADRLDVHFTSTHHYINLVAMESREIFIAGNEVIIPIYRGCDDMILGWEKPDDYIYHGNDGFGDVPDPDPPNEDLLKSEHGVEALINLTKIHPGEITLVAIAPLTNIAMAVRLDKGFGRRLKNCFIMGGNFKGEGNITASGEFNFYSDPEAAHIVLSHLECPITLASWELCTEHWLSWEDHNTIRAEQSAKAELLRKIENFTITMCKENMSPKYGMADEMAMACALDNDVITKSTDVYTSVGLHGSLTRGQMVVDWQKRLGKEPNVRLVTELNIILMKKMLTRAMGGN